MPQYLLRDQWGQKQVIEAKSPRDAVVKAYAPCGRPKIQRMWRSPVGRPNERVHVGYVIGQGRGNPAAWVKVDRLAPIGTGPVPAGSSG